MKYDFSKQTKARKIMIIATCCLAVILSAFSSFDVFADGSLDLKSLYSLDFNCFDYSKVGLDGTLNNQGIQLYSYLYNEDLFTVSYNSSLDLPNYVFYNSVINNKGNFVCLSEDSFILINENEFTIWTPTDNSTLSYAEFYSQNYSTPGFQSWGSFRLDGNHSGSYDGVSYYHKTIYRQAYDYPALVKTNIPVYYATNTTRTNGVDFDSNLNTPSTVGNVSAEQYDNYEYLTGNSGIYAALTSCNGGKMQFVAQAPTGMNTDNYYIKINGECSYSITVNSLTDDRTKRIVSKYTSYETTSSTFTKTISASGSVGGKYDSVFGHDGIQLSALNDLGVYEETQVNINNDLLASSNAPIYYLANYCTDNSIALWRGVLGSMSGLSANASVGSYGSFGYSLPTMDVVDNAPMTVNSIVYSYTMTMYNDNDESVGSLTKTFTINSDGSVNETDGANTLTVPNETVEENSSGGADYYNHSSDSNDTYNTTNNGTGSSGGSSVNGDNNIIINNNPVNNVNGGSGSGLTETDDSGFGSGFGVISKIISYIAGSKGSSVDKIDELANTDGWLSIVTSTYSFVPIQFWNLIITCFTVCLGIVIVAFIISIVIKLVT